MIVKFNINGMTVDTYECHCGNAPRSPGIYYTLPKSLSNEDQQEIEKRKQAAYRNYGYPATLVVEIH